RLPGGGAPLPMGGGGPPLPGGYWVITWDRESEKILTCCDGPPTPRTGPARPAGAWAMGAPAGTPLPAALPTPGPPATPARGTRAIPVCPSTVIETRFSPRSSTRPSTLFSSLSGCLEFLGLFICLSNALNVPMNIRPSCNIQRIR
uniref:Uncharacterized protein n=1 Tax=Electrophorus electricus TaxID=8005 RepID=A0A4W4EUT7_ELEEL